MTEIKLVSSLEKIFAQSNGDFYEIDGLSMLIGERANFQLAVFTDEQVRVALDTPDSIEINSYNVFCVPSKLPYYKDHDDDIIDSPDGYYPDLLRPAENGEVEFVNGGWCSVWFEVEAKSAGICPVKLDIYNENNDLVGSKTISIKVINTRLPEQTLICTHWFHCDCLATYYNVAVFSEEHWQIVENFMRTAVRHGINFLLTPLFTPPLDTAVGGERPTVQLVDVTAKRGGTYVFGFERLHRWFETAHRCGVKYFEMSHLFTQWGAAHAPKIVDVKGKKLFGWRTAAGGKKYRSFLTQFAAALKPFLKKEGVSDCCFFHVSDEPNESNVRAYGKASRLVHELFAEYKIVDALSEYEFYENGLVTTPIASESNVMDFVGRVDELWTYYCCGQYKDTANRFMAMPSYRNRVLGLMLYKYDCTGFLQWGYNFWYSRYSRHRLDPFTQTDAGESFPSGDAYVVYPGEGGQPLVSLRFKVFYDGFQDMMALQLLEKKIGREKAAALIDNNVSEPLSFVHYEKGIKWLTDKREEINALIEQAYS